MNDAMWLGECIGFGIFTFILGWMLRIYYEQRIEKKWKKC